MSLREKISTMMYDLDNSERRELLLALVKDCTPYFLLDEFGNENLEASIEWLRGENA